MDLRNMHDIGGCRAIVSTEKKLWQSVRALRRRAEFRTNLGAVRVRDYIKIPKVDGYRSYHLIGKFQDEYGVLRNIEVQIRTRIQHYWATALEIVDHFTDQALKSNRGAPDWKDFFRELGALFSLIDGIHLFDGSSPRDRIRRFIEKVKKTKGADISLKSVQRLCDKLRIVENMEAYANSVEIVNEQMSESKRRGYVLVRVNTRDKLVHTRFFDEGESDEANEHYVREEKEAAREDCLVVALISSTAVGGIKEAYPNFFADSTEFIKRVVFLQNIQL